MVCLGRCDDDDDDNLTVLCIGFHRFHGVCVTEVSVFPSIFYSRESNTMQPLAFVMPYSVSQK